VAGRCSGWPSARAHLRIARASRYSDSLRVHGHRAGSELCKVSDLAFLAEVGRQQIISEFTQDWVKEYQKKSKHVETNTISKRIAFAKLFMKCVFENAPMLWLSITLLSYSYDGMKWTQVATVSLSIISSAELVMSTAVNFISLEYKARKFTI